MSLDVYNGLRKTYCRNCKFHYFPNFDGSSVYDYCTITKRLVYEPLDKHIIMTTCNETKFNKDNACRYYERIWWKFWVAK